MNRCDNSGMQSHAWNRALSLSRYVRLVAKSFRVCEIVKQREESWPLSLSALAHNRTRITTRGPGGGEKAPVHNSHAWWTLLVFVRFMLCHATRSSLSIDACVRRSESGGVGGAILEENSCPIYLSGIIDRPYRVGREDIGWWAKEGRSEWTRVYGYFVILDFLKSIYMLYYIICITYIICYIIYIC